MNPNPRFDTSKSTQSIRSDIDSTRQRMDAKIDAIGERLKGRHIVDELVGYFRSKNGNGQGEMSSNLAAVRDKVTESAGRAIHSAVDSVKSHPLPSLLIGAGIAWFLYENARSKRTSQGDYEDGYPSDYHNELYESHGYAEDSAFVPEGYQSGQPGGMSSSKLQGIKQKASEMKQNVRQKTSEMGERIQQGAQSIQQRASQIGAQVQQRAQQAYTQGRQQVTSTAENHPVEVGLGLLGLGLIVGLALPTPQKMNQFAGPTADRLRRRARESGRELVSQGKHVVQAAADAARQEAENQGLTPQALREKVSTIATQAKTAARDTAQEEGAPFMKSSGESQTPPAATRESGSNI
jgi:ElaB/YqjD/DUF883 family membrane-anchored ribosome-binding protein